MSWLILARTLALPGSVPGIPGPPPFRTSKKKKNARGWINREKVVEGKRREREEGFVSLGVVDKMGTMRLLLCCCLWVAEERNNTVAVVCLLEFTRVEEMSVSMIIC